MLRTVQVMPSALVMIRLLPLLATATSSSRCGDQQRQAQVLSAAEVRLVQLLPSGEVITRLPVPLLLNATSRPSSAAQQIATQLLLVAATVLSAALVVGGFYLFKQDWLHTLVFGSYVGWSYAAYLAAVTGLFADILFNEARVCANLLNLFAVPPC